MGPAYRRTCPPRRYLLENIGQSRVSGLDRHPDGDPADQRYFTHHFRFPRLADPAGTSRSPNDEDHFFSYPNSSITASAGASSGSTPGSAIRSGASSDHPHTPAQTRTAKTAVNTNRRPRRITSAASSRLSPAPHGRTGSPASSYDAKYSGPSNHSGNTS